MKKKISSKADLKDFALKAGATVTGSNGQKFNTGKKKAEKRKPEPEIIPEPEKKILQKAEPKPKPELPAKPAGPDEGAKLVAETMQSMSRANVMMLAELKEQIAAIQFTAAQPITEWAFDFIRNDKGYLTRLTASAKTEKRTIN